MRLTGLTPRDDPMGMEIAQMVTSTEGNKWVVIGDVVILSLNVLGALFILGNMFANEIRRHAATTRMRIVQALIFSDVAMGIVGLVGSIHDLATKDGLRVGTNECNGLGVLIVAIMWSQHLWTLILAFSTFMILVHPLHSITSAIEKFWNWSWLIVWSISFGVAVLGYELYGFEPSGGICFWGNNSGLFGELIQFIPRGVVFLFIAIVYGRLYVFLKRPDKIRTGFSDSPTGTNSYSKLKHSWFSKSRRRFPFVPGDHKTVVINQQGDRIGIDTGTSEHSHSSKKSEPVPPPATSTPKPRPPPLVIEPGHKSQNKSQIADDIPPWERIELPAFQVDGQRYGGPEHHHHPHREHSMWGDWRGFHGPRSKRPPTTVNGSTSSVPSSTSTKVPGDSPLTSPTRTNFDKTSFGKNLTPTSASFDHKSLASPTNTAFSSGSTPPLKAVNEQAANEKAVSEATGATSATSASDFSLGPANISKPVPALWPMERESFDDATELRRSSAPTPSSEPVVSPPRRPSFIPSGFFRSSTPKPSTSTSGSTTLKASPPGTESQFAPLPNPGDVERGACIPDDDQDEKWDLKRMLDEAPPGNDRFAVTNGSENVEYVAESMASYLNRKTALLMLWFPLGYVVLFSVSLIRIIYDFSGEPPRALRAISRWMIFGQGLLDAIIYGLVEWHTKRVVRRRVRKGTFSPRTSHTAGSGIGSHLRAFGASAMHRGSRNSPNATAHTARQSQSHIGSRNQSPTVSFVDPEASIMQRLEPARE